MPPPPRLGVVRQLQGTGVARDFPTRMFLNPEPNATPLVIEWPVPAIPSQMLLQRRGSDEVRFDVFENTKHQVDRLQHLRPALLATEIVNVRVTLHNDWKVQPACPGATYVAPIRVVTYLELD